MSAELPDPATRPLSKVGDLVGLVPGMGRSALYAALNGVSCLAYASAAARSSRPPPCAGPGAWTPDPPTAARAGPAAGPSPSPIRTETVPMTPTLPPHDRSDWQEQTPADIPAQLRRRCTTARRLPPVEGRRGPRDLASLRPVADLAGAPSRAVHVRPRRGGAGRRGAPAVRGRVGAVGACRRPGPPRPHRMGGRLPMMSYGRDYPDPDGEEGRPGIRGGLLSRDDLRNLPAPAPLIDNTLDRRTIALLSGYWGTGKSFIALDWACCIATGKAWQGRAARQGKALYVAAEGAYGLDRRVTAWENAWPRGQVGLAHRLPGQDRPARRRVGPRPGAALRRASVRPCRPRHDRPLHRRRRREQRRPDGAGGGQSRPDQTRQR